MNFGEITYEQIKIIGHRKEPAAEFNGLAEEESLKLTELVVGEDDCVRPLSPLEAVFIDERSKQKKFEN